MSIGSVPPKKTLETQKMALKKAMLEVFLGQYGGELSEDQFDFRFNRLTPGLYLSVRLETISPLNHARLQLDVTSTDGFTKINPFRLKLMKGFKPGSLSDEIFVSTGSVDRLTYDLIYAHLLTREFQDYQNSKPRLLTINPIRTICMMSGNPLETFR